MRLLRLDDFHELRHSSLLQQHPAGARDGVGGVGVEHLGCGDAHALGVSEELEHVGQPVVADRGCDAAREEAGADARREAGVVARGRAESLGSEEEVAEAAGPGEVGGDVGVVLDCGGVAADADVGEEGKGLGPGFGFGFGARIGCGGSGLRAVTTTVGGGRWLRGRGGHGQRHGGEWCSGSGDRGDASPNA
nr:unnamed protein product [Digitaria exilis]